jgi:hypothetical protein
MKDISCGTYTIKLKKLPTEEWLVAVRDKENRTIASECYGSEAQAIEWATNLIDKTIAQVI